MNWLVRALLGVAVALPVAADAQAIRPAPLGGATLAPPLIVPLPVTPLLVEVRFPTVTPTIAPLPQTTPTLSPTPPTLTVTITDTSPPDANAISIAPPVAPATETETVAANVTPPDDRGKGDEGDGPECDDEDRNVIRNPNDCAPSATPRFNGWFIAIALVVGALFVRWIWKRRRR